MGPGHEGKSTGLHSQLGSALIPRDVCVLPPGPGTAIHTIKSSPQTERTLVVISCYFYSTRNLLVVFFALYAIGI